MVKKFKSIDRDEDRFIQAFKPALDAIDKDLRDMIAKEYDSWKLGGIIHDLKVAPLSKAISRDVFVLFFNELFQKFRFSGTLNTYWDVFSTIFDGNLTMHFDSPNPGTLYVDIHAQSFSNYDFVADEIINNEYEYSNVYYEDQDGSDQIILTSAFGLQTQEEADQIVYEMAINGIYTVITLHLS